MEEARLYVGEKIIDTLALIGNNDSLDEITINENGTMTVKFLRSTQIDDGEFVDVMYTTKGVTKISFK